MTDILANLNPPQQEAVKFLGSPLLILAGAGSGKTRVLTHRAAWLIKEKKVKPDHLLLLTFTNKAAGEMKERIRKLLSYRVTKLSRNKNGPLTQSLNNSVPLPFAGTFHSFCARVLRVDGKHIGIPPSFVIYDEGDQQEAIKQVLEKLGLAKTALKPSSALVAVSAAKNELISPQEYEETAYGEWQKRVAVVYWEYQKFLKEAGACDFDDLLVYTVQLFEEHHQILEKYQNLYHYILVDEWQDTNRAQYRLSKLLSEKHKNLTVVGDMSQSIYSWRGADYRNLEYLIRDLPEIKVINLEQNYRSTQTILDAAYQVISKNKTHPILKLWTQNGQGEKISLYQVGSELDEAAFIVNQINGLMDKWINRENKPNRLNYRDFAVLYRTNAQSRVLEEAFLHAGIPYILVGGVRFYERKEIKDVLAYLRLLVNPKDAVSKKRAEKLGKARFAKFTKHFKNSNYLTKSSTLEILDKVLAVAGYLDLYDPEDPEDIARLENIKELRSVATEFPNLVEFLEQIALVESAQDKRGVAKLVYSERQQGTSFAYPENSRGAVTLMTAHAAKGLEFPVVFLVGLEEGIFPHSRSLENEEELEEERRLCYVGMTRAKQKLFLTFCTRRLLFGQRTSNLPSRFLADIPEALIEGETLTLPKLSWLDPLER